MIARSFLEKLLVLAASLKSIAYKNCVLTDVAYRVSSFLARFRTEEFISHMFKFLHPCYIFV